MNNQKGLLFLAIMLRPGHGENKKSAVIKETSLAVLTVLSLAASIFATVCPFALSRRVHQREG